MEEKNQMEGMPMFAPGNPEIVKKEQQELRELESKGRLAKWKWYFAKSGPGWMQSAMTLGGGSAIASLFSGALMGFGMIWVKPLAMLVGIIMLSALAYQTLHTGVRPFYAMKKYVHPWMAYGWAGTTLLASLIWHFPQYSLIAGMSEDIIKVMTGLSFTEGSTGQTIMFLCIGVVVLISAILVCWNYGNGRKGIKLFEKIVKIIIWFIIIAFATVVIVCIVTGHGVNIVDVLKGFIPISISSEGISLNAPAMDSPAYPVFIASFSSAVGINMTFLFGYTFLARGWKKEHTGLAQFDMITGMFIPYTLATGLMVIAAGAVLHTNPEVLAMVQQGKSISPVDCAAMLEVAGLPSVVAHLLFGLGIIGMAFNAIVLHMLVCGFAACEMFNISPTGWKYKLATLFPVPGFLGVVLWSKIGTWIAIPTSAISLIFLPIAYIGFFLLNNNKKYLGDAMPTGKIRFAWNTAMIIAIIITIVCGASYLVTLFS